MDENELRMCEEILGMNKEKLEKYNLHGFAEAVEWLDKLSKRIDEEFAERCYIYVCRND